PRRVARRTRDDDDGRVAHVVSEVGGRAQDPLVHLHATGPLLVHLLHRLPALPVDVAQLPALVGVGDDEPAHGLGVAASGPVDAGLHDRADVVVAHGPFTVEPTHGPRRTDCFQDVHAG